MSLYQRIVDANRERYRTPVEEFDAKADPAEQRCPFCLTRGAFEREADYCYHDRTRLDVSIGYMHVQYGSLYCRFCQHEIPGTHIDKVEFAETRNPGIEGLGVFVTKKRKKTGATADTIIPNMHDLTRAI